MKADEDLTDCHIADSFWPDRIIIECSGSAFPATLAFQLRELERETSGDFKLDAIITVIDAENFMGYEDTSPTARMQASYTDLLVIVSPLEQRFTKATQSRIRINGKKFRNANWISSSITSIPSMT